jgi:large subunit ribosomal protein L9
VRDQFGIELDRKALHIDEPIREVGTHGVQARLHADVQFQITVEVSAAG